MVDGLTLDPGAHTYRYRGQVVPSVTQVLAPLSDFGSVPPYVLAAKADLGRRVHAACQFDDDDDLDEGSVEPDVEPYLAAYRRFRREMRPRIIANERLVYEPILRYAGQLDRVLAIDGMTWLVDLKTSFAVPRAVGPQTAAYHRAYGPDAPQRRAALQLRPDGAYRFDLLHAADDFATFLACLQVHRFKEQNPS